MQQILGECPHCYRVMEYIERVVTFTAEVTQYLTFDAHDGAFDVDDIEDNYERTIQSYRYQCIECGEELKVEAPYEEYILRPTDGDYKRLGWGKWKEEEDAGRMGELL